MDALTANSLLGNLPYLPTNLPLHFAAMDPSLTLAGPVGTRAPSMQLNPKFAAHTDPSRASTGPILLDRSTLAAYISKMAQYETDILQLQREKLYWATERDALLQRIRWLESHSNAGSKSLTGAQKNAMSWSPAAPPPSLAQPNEDNWASTFLQTLATTGSSAPNSALPTSRSPLSRSDLITMPLHESESAADCKPRRAASSVPSSPTALSSSALSASSASSSSSSTLAASLQGPTPSSSSTAASASVTDGRTSSTPSLKRKRVSFHHSEDEDSSTAPDRDNEEMDDEDESYDDFRDGRASPAKRPKLSASQASPSSTAGSQPSESLFHATAPSIPLSIDAASSFQVKHQTEAPMLQHHHNPHPQCYHHDHQHPHQHGHPQAIQIINNRRGHLPDRAIRYLKSWFFSHKSHPYPSEEQKNILMESTGLSRGQINNWFTNARRRLLPKSESS